MQDKTCCRTKKKRRMRGGGCEVLVVHALFVPYIPSFDTAISSVGVVQLKFACHYLNRFIFVPITGKKEEEY